MDLLEHGLMLIAHWNIFPGSDYFFNRSDVKKKAKFTDADESFELYGNRESDVGLTRYAQAILTQLLPTVERNCYKRVDGEKSDLDSEQNLKNLPCFPVL